MNPAKMLAELREERTRVEEAILALERMAGGHRRRGRPPAWMKAAEMASGQPLDKKKPNAKTAGQG